MTKNTEYEKRIAKLKYNEQLYYGYRTYLEKNKKKKPEYIDNQIAIIFPFLEHCEKEKINASNISFDQIKAYVNNHDRKVNSVYRQAFIDFFKMLKTEIKFSIEDLTLVSANWFEKRGGNGFKT